MPAMRKLLIPTVLLSAAAFAPNGSHLLAPQDPQGNPGASSRSVTSDEAIDAWITQLGAESYKERLAAEEQLLEIGAGTRGRLEHAAESHDSREVRWRARRLLRELDAARERPTGQGRDGRESDAGRGRERDGLVERDRAGDLPRIGRDGAQGRDPHDLRAHFDDLFRRFESEFGIDVPRGRFFDDSFFRDLQSQLGQPGGIGQSPFAKGGVSNGTSVQIGPDGVRVEVMEQNADGESERKVYEAPDLETFREKYPGVLGETPFGGMKFDLKELDLPDMDVRVFDGFDRSGLMPRLFRQDLRPRVLDQSDPFAAPRFAPEAPPEGLRLGVLVGELSPELRDYLELPDGVGLMVQDVQDGTLAASLGLRARDIVVEINGIQIGGPADVQRALGGIDKGEQVVVDFVRRGQQQQAKAEKQHAAEAPDSQQSDSQQSDSQQKARQLQPRRRAGERESIR